MLDRTFTLCSPLAIKDINVRKPDGSDEYIVDIVAYGARELTGHKTLHDCFDHIRDYFNMHKDIRKEAE